MTHASLILAQLAPHLAAADPITPDIALATEPTYSATYFAVIIARILLGVGVLLGIWRVWRGPGLPDRVVALDLLGTLSAGICVLTAIAAEEPANLIVAMVMALLLFVSTLAASHYLLAAHADRKAKARGDAPPELPDADQSDVPTTDIPTEDA